MVCLGKGMAAGLPSGAVLYNGEWGLPYHGELSMQGGNMATSFAPLKVLDFLTEEKLLGVREQGEMVIREIRKINSPHFFEVSGKGYMIRIEVGDKDKFDHEKANEIRKNFYENGVIITLVGKHNNIIKITPPLTITQSEILTLIEKLKVAIS